MVSESIPSASETAHKASENTLDGLYYILTASFGTLENTLDGLYHSLTASFGALKTLLMASTTLSRPLSGP